MLIVTSWKPGPPYGCMSTGSCRAPAYCAPVGATIAACRPRSPRRTNPHVHREPGHRRMVTFHVTPLPRK